MTATRRRSNGEGSIFPYRNGFAAYVWVTTPAGRRQRKYVYGKTRGQVHDKWIRLQGEARRGPIATSSPTVEAFLRYWLEQVVEPNLAPLTASTYSTLVRLYILPGLGPKRLDRLQVRDVQAWLTRVRQACQCCVQGKDAARPKDRRRCCAVGRCCHQQISDRTARDLRTVLRSALGRAISEELVSRNVAALVKVPPARKHRRDAWSVEEARRFLESARQENDPLYAAYVLTLVLGLRKGEVLGLSWPDVNLDAEEVVIHRQLQRVRRQLLLRETKTAASTAALPLPDVCVAGLQLRRKVQEADRAAAGEAWEDWGLVFTGRLGSPVDPRTLNRAFDARCERSGVHRIKVHDARRSCGSMLAALDVHPRVAMEVLRHAEFAITMEIYTEVSSRETREALRRLGARLDG
jgi:integrase